MTTSSTAKPEWFQGTVIFPVNEPDRAAVRAAQRVLRTAETGLMDRETRSLLQGFQALFKLRVTGILDLPTAIKLEEIRQHYA